MKRLSTSKGWTISELMIAATTSSVLAAGLMVGAYTIQKSYQASRHHVTAQAQQLRLMDYINLDLRRALTVDAQTERLKITTPDYYDADGSPRDPKIVRGSAIYGTSSTIIEYYRQNGTIYRSEGAVATALATEVSDFKLTLQDLGQSIGVSVTFLPRYQMSGGNAEAARIGTATFSTTLLRNKRQN